MSRGAGRKSRTSRGAGPLSPTRGDFLLPTKIFTCDPGLPAGLYLEKSFDNNSLGERVSPDRSNSSRSGAFFASADQPELPGLPEPIRTCKRCGSPVPAPKRNGRPTGFCSQACRKAAKEAGRDTWQPVGETASCWHCGQCYPIELSRTTGRLPRFCGDECRQAHKRLREARYRQCARR